MTASNENIGNNDLSRDDLWKELAVRAQQGDKQAYSRLLRDIFPYIKNLIRGSLANPDWAEDIAQEALISVHKSLATYSPECDFRPWLIAIVNFRKTDFLRKHYKNRRTYETATQKAAVFEENVTNTAHIGEFKDIESALADLPEGQRKIFEMIKIQGYSAKEVAKEMGMSVPAVKVSAHRTMNKLKERLG